MLDSIQSCCSSFYKPLTIAGAVLSLINGFLTAQQDTGISIMREKLDPTLSQPLYDYILMKLLIFGLFLIGVHVLFELYRKNDYSLGLFVISTFVLVIAILAMLNHPTQLYQDEQQIIKRLDAARALYNYKVDDPSKPSSPSTAPVSTTTPAPPPVTAAQAPTSGSTPADNPKNNSTQLDSETATQLWDYLQSFGCCGLRNSTEWTKLPISCCNSKNSSLISEKEKEFTCTTVDAGHQKPCIEVIELVPYVKLMLYLVLGEVALLAIVSGIQFFTRPKYQQASQSTI